MDRSALGAQHVLATADRMARQGDFAGAIPIYQQILRTNPRNTGALAQLGYCQTMRGDHGEARKTLDRALRIQPANPILIYCMALVNKAEGRFAEAHRLFDRSLALRPGDPSTLGAKAETYFMTGDYGRAYELLRPALSDETIPDAAVAMAFARVSDQIGRRAEGIDAVRRALERPGLGGAALATLQFRLGDLYDAEGEYDRAFEAYSRAHQLRDLGRWDAGAHSRIVDEVIRRWTREAAAAAPASGLRADRAVFVLGMWRSGTTLAEQILSAHPDIFGGDELADVILMAQGWPGSIGRPGMVADPARVTRPLAERAARGYLDRQRRLHPAAKRVTDKMPVNFLHLGLIDRVLPGARVIHCTRDPLDTCLSCYCKLLGGLAPYAHDLRHLGRFYRDYRRLMDHWRAVLGVPILDVAYESVVENTEREARRMLEFLGLSWHDACARSHENPRVARTASLDQVRRPVYRSSIGRWRNYEKHLGPLIDAIGS